MTLISDKFQHVSKLIELMSKGGGEGWGGGGGGGGGAVPLFTGMFQRADSREDV